MRYADDIIAGFEHEAGARSFLADLKQRMERFALSLNPDKTRLIEFGRSAAKNRSGRGLGKPESFNFLGFTHICWRGYGSGNYPLVRVTRRDRLRAKPSEIKRELRRCMYLLIPEQGKWLHQVVRGYYAYHAVPTNMKRIRSFWFHVMVLWWRALRRRSQRDRITMDKTSRIASFWLPSPRILHPWPNARFDVNHPRWEPGA